MMSRVLLRQSTKVGPLGITVPLFDRDQTVVRPFHQKATCLHAINLRAWCKFGHVTPQNWRDRNLCSPSCGPFPFLSGIPGKAFKARFGNVHENRLNGPIFNVGSPCPIGLGAFVLLAATELRALWYCWVCSFAAGQDLHEGIQQSEVSTGPLSF